MNQARQNYMQAAVEAMDELVRAARMPGAVDWSAAGLQPTDGVVPVTIFDQLVVAGNRAGLPIVRVALAAEEVSPWLRRGIPLMTPVGTEGEATDWLLVKPPVDGKVEIVRLGGAGFQRVVSGEELADELSSELAGGGPFTWIGLDPTRPLSTGEGEGEAPQAKPLHPIQRLGRLVRPDRRDLFAVVVFAIAIGVLLLATPIAVQALVNFVALGGAVPPLIVVMVLLFLGLACAGVLSALQSWVVEILQRRIFVRAVADLAARLPRLVWDSRGSAYGPEIVNRYFDLETLQKRGSFLLLDGLSVLLSVLVGLVVLAFYHPLLLAFDVIIIGIIVLIVLGPVRNGIKTAKQESSAKYALAAWLEEIARNPMLFKTSGVMRSVYERTDHLAREYVNRRARHYRIAFGQGVAALALQVIASTALLGIGGFLVIKGSLTLGQLVAAELILTLVVSSVAKMGKHLEAFYDLMAATDKLGILLDQPVERAGGARLADDTTTRGASLELQSVAWSPVGTDHLLEDVSFTAAPLEKIGIEGPSGEGKSVLLQTIWGLHSPKRGSIHLDGRDLRELSLDSLRHSAVLLDTVESFEGSVRENVDLGRTFVSENDVRAALAAVGLLEEVARLPAGIDTQMSADGRPLSTGQLVRLQLARAIAGRPRLLLVSDFFGQLAPDEREQILDVLFSDDAPWTLLFASNARDALDRCNRTFVLTHGRVMESTRPSNLSA